MPLSASLLVRIAVVIIVTMPSPALAEESLLPAHLEHRFRAQDVNQNDVIDRAETRISRVQFATMDRNGDQVLSRVEVRAEYERRVERARRERRQKRERSSPHDHSSVASSVIRTDSSMLRASAENLRSLL